MSKKYPVQFKIRKEDPESYQRMIDDLKRGELEFTTSEDSEHRIIEIKVGEELNEWIKNLSKRFPDK